MRYFLDTNVVIRFLKAEPKVVERMREIVEQQVFISSIVAAELYRGVFLSESKREAQKVAEFITRVGIIDFDHAAARICGEQYAALKRAGKLTQEFDLLIASVCLAHDGVFVTMNGKDFRNIEGLKLLAL
ncbi:type II toxin-antitoxin system VapC family toxin [Candidatus Woesearchaeota archaeon]|nr:MAG: type II toxin-antitoxin system VapC family toxin [Candidatus Woesearchaeota archaeon]